MMDTWEKLGFCVAVVVGLVVLFWVNFGLFLWVHGNTFYHRTPFNAQQQFTQACRDNVWGQENGVPDTHTARWTCVIPNGKAR